MSWLTWNEPPHGSCNRLATLGKDRAQAAPACDRTGGFLPFACPRAVAAIRCAGAGLARTGDAMEPAACEADGSERHPRDADRNCRIRAASAAAAASAIRSDAGQTVPAGRLPALSAAHTCADTGKPVYSPTPRLGAAWHSLSFARSRFWKGRCLRLPRAPSSRCRVGALVIHMPRFSGAYEW